MWPKIIQSNQGWRNWYREATFTGSKKTTTWRFVPCANKWSLHGLFFFRNGQKSRNSRTKHQMQEWERNYLIQLIIYNIIHSSKHIVQDNRKDFTKASTNDEIHLSTKNMQHSVKLNTLLVKLFHFSPINVMIEQICKKATTKCSILFTKFCFLICNFRHETPPHKRTHKTWQPAHGLAWK